jgi:hypothetical protein
MDPRETKPFQPSPPPNFNKTSKKTLATIRIPGIERIKKRSTSGAASTKANLWEGLRLPLKRTALTFGGLFLLILLGSWGVNAVKGMLGGSSQTATTTENPSVAGSSSPAASNKAATGTKTESCTTVMARMGAAKVSSKQVDQVFYQKHPDRVKNPITAKAEDKDLRQEWCSIANQLIEQGKTK